MTEKTQTHRSGCPLCRLYEKREIITRFYFENAQVIVVECVTCAVPMVVLKRHTDNPSRDEIKEMYWALLNQVPKGYQGKHWQIDVHWRTLQNHAHYHLRKVK